MSENSKSNKPIRSVRMTNEEWKIIHTVMEDPGISKQFGSLSNLLTRSVINEYERTGAA